MRYNQCGTTDILLQFKPTNDYLKQVVIVKIGILVLVIKANRSKLRQHFGNVFYNFSKSGEVGCKQPQNLAVIQN